LVIVVPARGHHLTGSWNCDAASAVGTAPDRARVDATSGVWMSARDRIARGLGTDWNFVHNESTKIWPFPCRSYYFHIRTGGTYSIGSLLCLRLGGTIPEVLL